MNGLAPFFVVVGDAEFGGGPGTTGHAMLSISTRAGEDRNLPDKPAAEAVFLRFQIEFENVWPARMRAPSNRVRTYRHGPQAGRLNFGEARLLTAQLPKTATNDRYRLARTFARPFADAAPFTFFTAASAAVASASL